MEMDVGAGKVKRPKKGVMIGVEVALKYLEYIAPRLYLSFFSAFGLTPPGPSGWVTALGPMRGVVLRTAEAGIKRHFPHPTSHIP